MASERVTPLNRDAVLLDELGCIAIRTEPEGALAVILDLGGRLNKTTARVTHRYAMSVPQAAELVANLVVTARRTGADFIDSPDTVATYAAAVVAECRDEARRELVREIAEFLRRSRTGRAARRSPMRSGTTCRGYPGMQVGFLDAADVIEARFGADAHTTELRLQVENASAHHIEQAGWAHRAEARVRTLTEAARDLLREYEVEEREDGFPFNFALRDAHRRLRAALTEAGLLGEGECDA